MPRHSGRGASIAFSAASSLSRIAWMSPKRGSRAGSPKVDQELDKMIRGGD
jgi:hypothetical protein